MTFLDPKWLRWCMALLLVVFCATLSGGNGGSTKKDEKKQAQQFMLHMTKAIKTIREEHILMPKKSQLTRWAIQGLYRELKIPIPKAISRRLQRVNTATDDEMRQLIFDARLHLGSRKKLQAEKDLQFALKAIFTQMEPSAKPDERSEYYDPEACRGLLNGGSAVSSIGLKVRRDSQSGLLQVITPLYNGPAHKAGIRAGDLIATISVDTTTYGKSLSKPKIYSTKGMTVKQANEIFLGMRDTSVKLTIIPGGKQRK